LDEEGSGKAQNVDKSLLYDIKALAESYHIFMDEE